MMRSTAEPRPAASPFPSLAIGHSRLVAEGAFAEAQADFLDPDRDLVGRLEGLCREHQVGIVAHFYMDPELQGVLSACDWPHIQISDSLLMADAGVRMAEAGMKAIVVLGVDFMSENVRAMLDAAGHDGVPVYRVAAEPIGCSLAESADKAAYAAYLTQAAQTPRSLHVVYINTSLQLKARAHHRLPTITCTSSNVVKTVLAAFAQIPGLNLWFGPDTYMGNNLRELFEGLAKMDDAAIRRLHEGHDRASIAALLERFHYFQQGTCVVHHMFGQEVVDRVERHYPDVYVTAHLEVPGEMFRLALQKQQQGRGVVGSTSNILDFIAEKVRARAAEQSSGRLRFVLGTEAGMITSIVRKVQSILREANAPDLEAEIIFPVASEAIAQTADAELPIVPGVSGGEGCSTAGGCATCPFMKMNSLDALMDLLERLAPRDDKLVAFHPRKYVERIDGRTAAELGGEPILHMRHFQRTGQLSEALVQDVLTRNQAAG